MLARVQRYFRDKEELEGFWSRLPQQVCLRCGARGTLVRHGYLRGWITPSQYGIRGWRIFCDPDSPRGRGCGWGPGLWLSSTLRRRCFSAGQLLLFILALRAGRSVRGAWRRSAIPLSLRTGYRLHRRLNVCQSILRSCLCSRSPPPKWEGAGSPLLQVFEHLRAAFGDPDSVKAYQETLQRDFLARA